MKRRIRVGKPNLFYLEPLFEKLEAMISQVRNEKAERLEAEKESDRYSGFDKAM